MHSGFTAVRSHFPMNIEALLPDIGERILREQVAVRADVNRIVQIWSELLIQHNGPLLFGAFTIADAYFAPIIARFRTYDVPVPTHVAEYMAQVQALPGVAAWHEDALAEQDFLQFEEPYRKFR
jgi:glutathione S-transferase